MSRYDYLVYLARQEQQGLADGDYNAKLAQVRPLYDELVQAFPAVILALKDKPALAAKLQALYDRATKVLT